MATVIDSLFISLGVEPKGVVDGMQKAESTIQSGLKNIMGFIAPLIGAAGFGALISNYLKTADALGKFSDSIGANIEDVHAWGEAVIRSGGSAEGFQSTLQSLTSNLTHIATTGKSRMTPFFEAMGLQALDSSGKVRKAFDILPEIAEKFEKMSKAESLGYGQKLGLDQGTIMLLQSGRKAVEDLIKKQKELGVYTKEDALITAKANDAISDLGQAFKAMSAIFLRIAVPALQFLVEILTNMVKWIRENKTFTISFFTLLATIIAVKLIPVLYGLAAAGLRALAPFAPIIAIIGALALVIDDLIVYMKGGKSTLSAFWSLFGTGEEIMWALTTVSNFLLNIFTKFPKTIGLITAAFIALKIAMRFLTISNPFVFAIMAIVTAIGLLIDKLGGLKETFRKVSEFGKNMVNKVKGWFGIESSENTETPSSASTIHQIPSSLALSPSSINKSSTITSDTQLNISNLQINTQATDANGIAKGIGGALNTELTRGVVMSANTGVAQK